MSTPSRSEPAAGPRPWASWGLGALLLGFHGLTAFVGVRAGLTWTEALFYARLRWYRQLIGGQHERLLDAGEWERLVSSILVHADVGHLLLNTLAILVVGSLVERFVGPVRLLTGFVACGAAGSLASWLWGPAVSDGASGAAFGLLGLAIARGLVLRASLDSYDRTVILRWLPGFVLLNLGLSAVLPSVDIVAHLGGLVAGLLLGLAPRGERAVQLLEGGAVLALVLGVVVRSLTR